MLAEDVRACLGDNLVALVLGGGYGRNEGAIILKAGLERPYNDLDLFLIVHNPSHCQGLAEVSHKFECRLGIDVDFSKPLTPDLVQTLPHSLMWHDLLRGHLVLWGPENYLRDNAPRRLLQVPPKGEAVRLLLNRGVGLLWANRVREGLEEAPDPDFVRRNYFKAALALGRSTFLAQGRSLPLRPNRVTELKALGVSNTVAKLYQDALQFKLSPDGMITGDFSQLLALWEDQFRSYLEHGLIDPEVALSDSPLRNLLRNLRVSRISFEHPRAILYRRLLSVRTNPSIWPELFQIWSKYN